MTQLGLGTGMWGWTIPREEAFKMLDKFYQAGYRLIDTATNYPISKNPEHWRLAEKILAEWIKTHGISDLKISVKVGSVNNLFTPEHNLSKSFLLMNLDYYQDLLGNNLHIFAIHWDNRSDKKAVENTFEALAIIQDAGLKLGFSGVKHPTFYSEINQNYDFDFFIQIKHNILKSDYKKYADFHGNKRFIAYGLNAGGLKLNKENYTEKAYLKMRGGDVNTELPIIPTLKKIIQKVNENKDRPPIQEFFQVGITHAFYHSDMYAMLVGCSSVAQLLESVGFYQALGRYGYRDFYEKIRLTQ